MNIPDTATGKRLEADALLERASTYVKQARTLYRLAAHQAQEPARRYVTVVIDEAAERSVHVKQYTYEDVRAARGDSPLKVGDRVYAPVGTWGHRKAATVVRVDAPALSIAKPLHQLLTD